jgi:lysozyme family protein
MLALYTQLQKDTKDPLYYFDIKNMKSKCNQLATHLKNKQELTSHTETILDEVYRNTKLFES